MIQATSHSALGGWTLLYPIFWFVLPFVTLLVAFVIGSWQERRHFRRLEMEETRLSGVFVTDLKTWPDNWTIDNPTLVSAGVVIANDKFKAWIASWVNFFGGRIVSYEKLLDRARREALVRVQAEAERLGANAVWNVRIETATIGGGVEAMAFGTAAHVLDNACLRSDDRRDDPCLSDSTRPNTNN